MVNFRGFFLPKEKDSNEERADSEDDSESDNDDFENPDYHDIIQISSGKYQSYSPSRMRCVAERLQELEDRNGRSISKGEKVVRARFDGMFSQPWWMVEVIEINTGSRTQRPEKIPSYSIRCDDGVDKSLLSLFLTRGCCVNEQHVASFLEFIEDTNLRMTFVDLLGNLREFASSGEINSEIAEQIRRSFASKRELMPQFCSGLDIMYVSCGYFFVLKRSLRDSEQCSRESRKRWYFWPPLYDSHPAVSEFLTTQLISVLAFENTLS